jgi:hypothetical protein
MTDVSNTTSARPFGITRTLIAAVVVVAVVGTAVLTWLEWAQGSATRADALDSELFVPILVTPSVQVADGQVLLFKITNVSDSPRGVRMMLQNEEEKDPFAVQDFPKIAAAMTVSYIHEPSKGQVKLGDVAVEGPRPVRAIFQPLPGDDPGAVRNIVAAAQIVRLRQEGATTHVVDVPVVVPVEHCMFEPRGFMSQTGGRWHWNCAPQMFPIHPHRHVGGLGPDASLK